jgi:hypothetical protein
MASAWWYIPGNQVRGTSTREMTLNYMFYFPWFVEVPYPIDQLGVEVTTAAAGALPRLGIYNADTNWQPSTLFLDAGTVDASTTGLKTKAVSVTLPAGRLIGVIVSNISCNIRLIKTDGAGMSGVGIGPSVGTNPSAFEWYRPFTYAPLPASGTGIPWSGIAYTTEVFQSGLLVRRVAPT